MGRSLRFRVCAVRLSAHFGLAFAPGPDRWSLPSPYNATRRVIMQKARRHPPEGGLRPLCRRMVSGTLSLRSQRIFSSFSRLTDSLSVVREYLALEGGPPVFTPGFTSPMLLLGIPFHATTGPSPSSVRLSSRFAALQVHPLSLAATYGVAVAFLSCGY